MPLEATAISFKRHLNSERHLNNIDFARLALALLVVFSHCFVLVRGTDDSDPFMRLTGGQVTGGTIAVDAFFILSGFLITASYQRSSSALSFLKKRIARIYPGFLVVTLVSAFCFVPLGGGRIDGQDLRQKIGFVLASVVRLRDIHSSGAFGHNPFPHIVNASLWTVSYEFFCYLGVLLLGLTMALHRRRMLIGALCASIAVSLLYAHFGWHTSKCTLTVLFGYPEKWARLTPMYLAGVVFYLYRDSISFRLLGTVVSLLAMVLACVVPCGYTLLFPVFGTYLLMHLAFADRLALHRIMRFGDLSYGAYLYAFPIQQLMIQQLGLRQSALKLFFAATPVVLAAAAVSWFCIERPALRLFSTGRHSIGSMKRAPCPRFPKPASSRDKKSIYAGSI
jgi:peptidoglycan/LPS O-acetylase OafA/YrhL